MTSLELYGHRFNNLAPGPRAVLQEFLKPQKYTIARNLPRSKVPSTLSLELARRNHSKLRYSANEKVWRLLKVYQSGRSANDRVCRLLKLSR